MGFISVISSVTTEVTKTEITVTVTASDNIGVTEYWYSIDDNAYIKETTNTHTFTGLGVYSSHTIKVYVKDAIGNTSEITTKENVKTKADCVVLVRKEGSISGQSFTYEFDGQSYTVTSDDEEWVVPIGAVFEGRPLGYYIVFLMEILV